MNAWHSNNYSPFYYWPENYWPDLSGSGGTQTITLTGHSAVFTYGTHTIGDQVQTGGGGGRLRFLYFPPEKPRKKRIITRTTFQEFSHGKPMLRQKLQAKPTRTNSVGGGSPMLRQELHAEAMRLGFQNGNAGVSHARRQTIRPYSSRLRLSTSGARCRPQYVEHDEELAILLAILK
jgi:hypothetical protein